MRNDVCLIVSGGSADLAFLSDYCRQFSFRYIIAADRGLETVRRLSLSPTHLVGDFDSVDEAVLKEYVNDEAIVKERLIPEKDDTDTEHAMNMAVELGCAAIILAGASGTRFDHTLANVHILYKAFQKQMEAWMIDRHNKIRLISGRTSIKRKELFGKYISLFPFSGIVSGVTLTGFKYPLKDKTLDPISCFGLCVSNELLEDSGTIEIKDGILLLIESRD